MTDFLELLKNNPYPGRGIAVGKDRVYYFIMGRSANSRNRVFLEMDTNSIVEAIHSVLERTPPELSADIADRGIVLTGGGSLLRGLEDLITDRTGITCMTAEDPMTAVAIGTGKYVEFISTFRSSIE